MIKILETGRLTLRKFEITDKEYFFELNADPDVIKYTGDQAFESVDFAEKFLKNYTHYSQYGYRRWAVILKDNGTFTGWCGLKYNPEIKEVDLGFRFFKKYWNKGYATEAGIACIQYGFNHLGVTKIIGRVMNNNIASIRVLEKAGLHFEKEIDFNGEAGSCYCIYKT